MSEEYKQIEKQSKDQEDAFVAHRFQILVVFLLPEGQDPACEVGLGLF